MGVEDHSEYDGGGVMPNTVHPKGTAALTASDQFRLQSLTGQETDSRAPVDPYHWYGGTRPDGLAEAADRAAREERMRQMRQHEADRYRETPLPY